MTAWQVRRLAFAATTLIAAVASFAAVAEPAAPPRPNSNQPTCDRERFRVVVDVGHTAMVPGATSARGATEYSFNLRLAKHVEQALIDAGFGGTMALVTDGPAVAGLFKRVSDANSLPTDLILSIHHDSVPEKFKEEWEYEGQKQKFSDRFSGHSLFVSFENAHRAESMRFGHLLGVQLKTRGLKYTPHYTEAFMGPRRRDLVDSEAGVYRFDKLRVLRGSTAPAVLLEAGSIVNRDDELALATPERQDLIGAAVVDAVDTFCATRPKQVAAAKPAATPPRAADEGIVQRLMRRVLGKQSAKSEKR